MESEDDDTYMDEFCTSCTVAASAYRGLEAQTSHGAQLDTHVLAKMPLQLMVACTPALSLVNTLAVYIVHRPLVVQVRKE